VTRILGLLGLGCGLAGQAFFGLAVLPTISKMLRDFSTEPPLLTRIVLAPAWSLGWSAALLGGVLLALFGLTGRAQKALLIAALAGTAASWVATLVACYLPVFYLAAAVK
jgi:hypothetical protein